MTARNPQNEQTFFVIVLKQAGQVWVMDLIKPDLPIAKITDVGRHLHDAFLSPDGRYLVVSSYDDNLNAVIDLEEKRVIKRIPAGCQPHLGSGAVVRAHGRLLGIGANIGEAACESYEVTVFDMETFEVVKRIPVIGSTESSAAHPDAPYIVVDIVGTGPDAKKSSSSTRIRWKLSGRWLPRAHLVIHISRNSRRQASTFL